MRNGHLIVDVDAHYLEPVDELADYLDDPWRTRIKEATTIRLLPEGLGDRFVQGRIRREGIDYGHTIGTMRKEQMVAAKGKLDIDCSIIIASRILTAGHTPVRDLVLALANGYIDYMLDNVADPALGLYTMPIVPWQDPELGAELVERVAGHPAVVGVCMTTSGPNVPLGDRIYDPIYEAAQRHRLPVVFHGSPGITLVNGTGYADGFQRLIEAHSLGFSVANMVQLTSLLMQGIPERFPDLRFVFQESGVFWVPMMMFRLDEYYLKRRDEAPLLNDLPSRYVLDRFYFGTQPIEAPRNPKYLESVFEMANGYEHFLFASDYPHFDYDDPTAILKLPFLDQDQKANVLARNAQRVFDFRKGGVQPWETTSQDASTTSPSVPVAS